jgi:hypothetical protein
MLSGFSAGSYCFSQFVSVKVRLQYTIEQSREFNLLDEYAWRVFEKFASTKVAKSVFLLDEFARANLSIKLGTLLDSVNAPIPGGIKHRLRSLWIKSPPGRFVIFFVDQYMNNSSKTDFFHRKSFRSGQTQLLSSMAFTACFSRSFNSNSNRLLFRSANKKRTQRLLERAEADLNSSKSKKKSNHITRDIKKDDRYKAIEEKFAGKRRSNDRVAATEGASAKYRENKKPKDLKRAIGKLDKEDWNIKNIEEMMVFPTGAAGEFVDKLKTHFWSNGRKKAKKREKREKLHISVQNMAKWVV